MLSFCVYMLECADGSIYVGHTEDVEARLIAHQTRRFGGYTARRLPVRLIFAEEFSTREDAFTAERMLKGWRRSKKLALAKGDWEMVRALAAVRSPERRALRAVPGSRRPQSAHGTGASP
jgi:predicted GIY-YIG superfamily endonuclease